MREHSEWLGQFLACEFLCRLPYFDGLRHSNIKIFRLFDEASRRHFVCFGRVNEIKTKQVFLIPSTHVKAVAIIRRVRDQPTILQHNPIFGSIAGGNIANGRPNNGGADDRSSGETQRNRRANDQMATSKWLRSLNTWQR
jgi:hypothetical protein